MHSDYVIRHLRKPGDTNHYLPKKGLYKNCVTSANYLGEITEWLGFAISLGRSQDCSSSGSRAATSCRAAMLSTRSTRRFPDEFDRKKLKRIIPFIY